MAKDVITVDGKEVVVREDTAKAYRFVVWGVTTAAIALAIMAFLVFVLFFGNVADTKTDNSAPGTNSSNR